MRTQSAMRKLRESIPGWTVALGILLGGLTAQAQSTSATGTATATSAVRVTTGAVTGNAQDTVVASVVETGVRTGARVTVTLRLLDSNGAIVAQTSGLVSDGVPLRLVYRAPSTAGVSAQVVIPLGATNLSAPVVTIERWNPDLPLAIWPPIVCHPPMVETDPPPGPVLNCQVERLDRTTPP
ncbi:hypothetical protein ACLESD_42730 [Pyxidicoccus sp. 3LFB2]